MVVAAVGTALTAAPAHAFGPLPPPNPASAPNGAATMHGDSASSDTTPLAGPGAADLDVTFTDLGAACPAILIGSDEQPVALCTGMLDRAPVVHLLDKATGTSLASLRLEKGGLFSGVYAYLDERDRLVMVDGAGDLLRIAHRQSADGTWHLDVAERTPLGLGEPTVGIAPDWRGRVWLATGGGVVGVHDPATGATKTLRLGEGERVDNSISTAPEGTAVATSHALYLLDAGADGAPRVVWRAPYERGPARKPGQLSHGTGATPTFFGPRTGTELLAITDNADPHARLLVFETRAAGAGTPAPGAGATPARPGATKPGAKMARPKTRRLSAEQRRRIGCRVAARRKPTAKERRRALARCAARARKRAAAAERRRKARAKVKAKPAPKARATTAAPRLVCAVPVLTKGGSGTENSPIGSGRTVIVASTYGYPYPALPEGAGESEPKAAPFTGGMTRVDVRADGSGCETRWDSAVRSAAVPKLSTSDGLVYTVTRTAPGNATTSTTAVDGFAAAVVDAQTGAIRRQTPIGTGFFRDALQLAGQIGPGRVVWQGAISGVWRLAPKTP